MTSPRIPSLLFDLVDHAERIHTIYAERGRATFLADKTACEAALWNFIVLGEICMRLGEPFQREHPSVPWQAVIGQRHVIAHGYDRVNWERICDVIERHIPPLIRSVRTILDTFGPPPSID